MHPISPSPLSPRMILIGGSVRAAAEDAVTAGYQIIAIDRFGDRDLLAICECWHPLDRQQHWIRLIDAWPTVPVVPIGGFTWPGGEGIAGGHLVAYPAPEVLGALSDPEQLRLVALRCGIDFPKTFSPTEASDREHRADQPAPQSSDGRPGDDRRHDWLVKPRFGAGGVGIRRWRSGPPPPNLPANQQVLQQRVAGRPMGVSYFARRRQGLLVTRLLGACDGLTHRKHHDWPWLYGGSVGPHRLAADCHAALSEIGRQVATTFGLVGLFNIDFIRRRGGALVLLEINPRYSASMELLSTQAGNSVSLIDWHLAAYQEDAGRIETEEADRRMHWCPGRCGSERARVSDGGAVEDVQSELACKRIVYAAGPMCLECSADELSSTIGSVVGLKISFHDLPTEKVVSAGCPALSVMVRGGSDVQALVRYSHRIAAYLRHRRPRR